jgi:hypothetical protein
MISCMQAILQSSLYTTYDALYYDQTAHQNFITAYVRYQLGIPTPLIEHMYVGIRV